MKRFLFVVAALFLIAVAMDVNAQTPIQPPSRTEQIEKMMQALKGPATYGGKVTQMSRGRVAVRSGSTVGTMSTAPTNPVDSMPSKFSVELGKLQINERNADEYVIPVTVTSLNSASGDSVGSVTMTVNGQERALQQFYGSFLLGKYEGFLPLRPEEHGALPVDVIVAPRDGSRAERFFGNYDVPMCRIPDLIAIPNPPHDMHQVTFMVQKKGLDANLMPGGMKFVRGRKGDFTNFDPNKPQSEWYGIFHTIPELVVERNGFWEVTTTLWPGAEGDYVLVAPSVCGRMVASNPAPFYTDEKPRPIKTSLEIDVKPSVSLQIQKVDVVLRNPTRDGHLEAYADGIPFWPDGTYGHWTGDWPVRVKAGDGEVNGHFELFTITGFTYAVHVYYWGFTSQGWLELFERADTARYIPGTMPPKPPYDIIPGGKG